MLEQLVPSWWLFQMRGIFAIAFGAFLLFLAGSMEGRFTTAIAMVAVILIFAFYLIGSGALSFLAAFRNFATPGKFCAALIHGTVMLAVGSLPLFSNRITVMWLVWFTVANALGSGMLELALARRMRRHVDTRFLTLAGAVSVATSVLLILARNEPVTRVVNALGFYALFYGVVLIVVSVRLHSMGKHPQLAAY